MDSTDIDAVIGRLVEEDDDIVFRYGHVIDYRIWHPLSRQWMSECYSVNLDAFMSNKEFEIEILMRFQTRDGVWYGPK